jgi:hypothetical protein
VQFRERTDDARERFAGRVEHVVSGRAAHFRSPEQLTRFMRRVLRGFRSELREEAEERSAAGGGRRYRGASGSSRLPGLGKSESKNGSKGEKR